MREVRTQPIAVKVNLEGKATFPMQRMIGTCNVKLMN